MESPAPCSVANNVRKYQANNGEASRRSFADITFTEQRALAEAWKHIRRRWVTVMLLTTMGQIRAAILVRKVMLSQIISR